MVFCIAIPACLTNINNFNIGTAVTARTVRLLFDRLSPASKKKTTSPVKRTRYVFLSICLGLLAIFVAFYQSNLKKTPITQRKRCILYGQEEIEKNYYANVSKIKEAYEDNLYGETDVPYLRVVQIARRLVETNPELQPFKKWNINVSKDPLRRGYATKHGYVLVTDGWLQLANTQDQLALIIAHEMAHVVLGHEIEYMNCKILSDYFLISYTAVLWLFTPTVKSSLTAHFLFVYSLIFAIELPYRRQVETEADNVGLMFASRACFDVREGSIMWQKLSLLEKQTQSGNIVIRFPEWASTHPDSLNRAQHIDFLQHQAEEWRNTRKCPALPDKDPRDDFNNRTYKTL